MNLHNDSRMGYRLLLYGAAISIIAVLVIFGGCGIEKTDDSRISDAEYEIVEEEDFPQELKEKIEEKKASDFKLTYEGDTYLYVVRGYGEQETGGYSIQITDFYLTKNAVVFDTNLIGPSKDETKNAAPSYPYLVVRMSNPDKNVIFK